MLHLSLFDKNTGFKTSLFPDMPSIGIPRNDSPPEARAVLGVDDLDYAEYYGAYLLFSVSIYDDIVEMVPDFWLPFTRDDLFRQDWNIGYYTTPGAGVKLSSSRPGLKNADNFLYPNTFFIKYEDADYVAVSDLYGKNDKVRYQFFPASATLVVEDTKHLPYNVEYGVSAWVPFSSLSLSYYPPVFPYGPILDELQTKGLTEKIIGHTRFDPLFRDTNSPHKKLAAVVAAYISHD
jgi:hypothetical protein